MGVVYLATDERLGRKVALKVIAPHLSQDPESRARFEAEAKNAAAIDHPNAVPIYSAGSAEGSFFIAMRYVQGSDLRQVLVSSGRLGAEDAVAILADVAAALDAAHAAGLIHRDVKPANILVTGLPGKGSAYLTDFGLTRNPGGSSGLTRTGQWMGTLDYVAPEQMTGDRIDARADVYALGCVLYEMLAGAVPFPGDEMQKLWAKAHTDLPPLPSGARSHPLDPVIRRATTVDPDDRFPSAGDLARAAKTAVGGGEPVVERSVATGPAAILPRLPEAATAAMPQRTAIQPTPATPNHEVPPRAGGHGRSVAIVLASLILGAGLVLAALLSTREDGGTSAGAPAASRTEPGGARASRAESSASADTETGPSGATETGGSSSLSAPTSFEGKSYTVDLPAGWLQLENEKVASDGSYVENKWRSPDGAEEILIDESAGAPADPAESAATIGGDVAGAGETVYSITDGVVHGGVEGSELDFHADSGLPERADFFFNIGDAGFALLASGHDLARAQQRLDPVLTSLQTYP